MRRRHRRHRSFRRRLATSSTARLTLFLVIGLVVIGGLFSLLSGAQDVFTAIMSIPDGLSLSEAQRKAVAPR